jgi:hypothetical protein
VRDEIATVGDDGTLRIIELVSRRCLQAVQLSAPARCITYSPDGTQIAIGLGAPAVRCPWQQRCRDARVTALCVVWLRRR